MPKKSTKKNSSSIDQPKEDQIDDRLFVDNVNLLELNDENHNNTNNNNLLTSTVSERSDSVSSSAHNIRARERQRQHEKELEANEKNLQQRSSSTATATKKRSSSKKKQRSKREEQQEVVPEADEPFQQQRQKSGTFSNALEAELLGPLYDDSKPPEGFASPSSAEFMRQQHLQQQRIRNNAKENDPDALLQELLTRQSSGTSNSNHNNNNNNNNNNTSTRTSSQEGDEAHAGLKTKTSSSSGSSYNHNQQNKFDSTNITSSGTGGLLALSSPPKHHIEQSRKQSQKQQQSQLQRSSSSSSASPQPEKNKANTKIVTTRSGKTKRIIVKPRAPLSAAEIARRKKERQRELEQVYSPLAHVLPPPKESLGSLFPTKFILLLTVGILAGLAYSIVAIIFGAATFEDHVDGAICKAKSPSAGVRPVPYRIMVLASVTSVLVPVIINLVKYRKTSIESLASIDQRKNNSYNNISSITKRTRTPTRSNKKKDLERNLLEKNTSEPRSPSAAASSAEKKNKNKKTKLVTLTKIVTRPVPKEERSKNKNAHDDEDAEESAEDEEEFYEEEEEYEEEVECSSAASSSSMSSVSSPANSPKSPQHRQSDDDHDDGSDEEDDNTSNDGEEEDDVHHLADDEFSDSKSNQDKNSTGDLYRSSRENQNDGEDDEDGEDESFSWNERLPFLDSINRKGYKELAWIFQIYATVDARWYLAVVLYTIANFAYNIFAIQDERETTFAFSNVWDRYQSFYLRWFQSGTVAALGIYFTQLLTTMVCFEIAGTPNEIGEKDFLKEKLQMLKEKQLEAADASLMRMMNPTNGGSSSPPIQAKSPSASSLKNRNNNQSSSSLASLGAGAEEMKTQQQFANTSNNNSEDLPSLFVQDEANKIRDMKNLTRVIANISLPLATLLVSKSEEITDTLTFAHVFLGGLLLYPGFITHVLPSAVIFLPLTVLFAIPPAMCYFAIRSDLRPFASLLERDSGKEGLCRRHRISVICAILTCRIVGTFVVVALCQTMMCYSSMFFSSSKGPYGTTISNEVNYRDMDCYLWAMNEGEHDVYHKLQMIGLIFS